MRSANFDDSLNIFSSIYNLPRRERVRRRRKKRDVGEYNENEYISHTYTHTYKKTYYAMNPIAINVKRGEEEEEERRGKATTRRRRNECNRCYVYRFQLTSIRFRVSDARSLSLSLSPTLYIYK